MPIYGFDFGRNCGAILAHDLHFTGQELAGALRRLRDEHPEEWESRGDDYTRETRLTAFLILDGGFRRPEVSDATGRVGPEDI